MTIQSKIVRWGYNHTFERINCRGGSSGDTLLFYTYQIIVEGGIW